MNIGILTRNKNAWCSSRLREAFTRREVTPVCLKFQDLVGRVAADSRVTVKKTDIRNAMGALLVRPIGRGSLDETIFRLNLLHSISRAGLPVVNHPSSIERAADKYLTLSLLSEKGVKVPRTVVTESVPEALRAFREFGGDAVVKPVFGSRGIGAARISNEDVADRTFRTLRFNRHILYVQEFIQHGTRDIRAFVVGGKLVAAMFRIASSWKTNVSKGAKPTSFKGTAESEELAIKSANTIGTEIAGVDLMESRDGLLVTEVNSQPGWRGLQSTTQADIAGEIADFVISKAKR